MSIIDCNLIIPYCGGILIKDNKVLLIFRANTDFGNGNYAIPGGKVDCGERVKQSLIREMYEEIGVIIKEKDLEFAHVMYFQRENSQRVIFFFKVLKWDGEPFNKEPDKHDHIKWFDLNELPENMLPRHKKALGYIAQKKFYSESDFN